MNRTSFTRPLLAAAVAFGALAAGSAQARSDVYFSVGVQAPVPVYVQPQPVYVQPQPVYVEQQPVYVQPQPVYVQPQPVHRGHHRWQARRGPWGDFDRDGVPNRFDRFPGNPYWR